MAKRGRKPIEDPRHVNIKVRVNNREFDILKSVCDMTGMGVADVLRTGVEKLYEIEKNKED